MESKRRNILVTGASSGIGHATARALLAHGDQVWGTVRSLADADSLQTLGGDRFHPVLMDLADAASIDRAVAAIQDDVGADGLQGLINNAGVAHPGPLASQPFQELRNMFEVNFFGLVHLTRACLPSLGMRSPRPVAPGKIVNVSSGAGKLSIPFLAGYVASKHALEGLSNSLRRELLPWQIPVVVVGPGNVKTPIWNKAGDDGAYDDTVFGPVYRRFIGFMRTGEQKGMEAHEIATVILQILDAKNPKTRYEPVAQKFSNWTLPRLLPDKTIDRMLFKAFGMKEIDPQIAGR